MNKIEELDDDLDLFIEFIKKDQEELASFIELLRKDNLEE